MLDSKRALPLVSMEHAECGGVAQSVEQWTENPRVPSSILGPATTYGSCAPVWFISPYFRQFDKRVAMADKLALREQAFFVATREPQDGGVRVLV